jgi:D-alanine-D-alanine ligase
VLKPVNEGSSVGVAIVTAEGNYGNPISARCQGAVAGIRPLLAEPFIRGRELTTAVLGDKALMVTELKPKSGFYDFDAKYTEGMTEHVCPARSPTRSPRPARTLRCARTGCWAARAAAAPISAGTTRRASKGCSCWKPTPSRG